MLPTILLTVTPKEHDGEYYISCLNAMWCVMPSRIGVVNDTIRFMFTNDNVEVLQLKAGEQADSWTEDEETADGTGPAEDMDLYTGAEGAAGTDTGGGEDGKDRDRFIKKGIYF